MFIRHHTMNFGDTATRIKKHVAELDRDWFLRKKREFEKLCDKDEDFYEYVTPSDTQVVDFDLFCFSATYSQGVTGSSIADKIIATTNSIVDDAGDDKEYTSLKFWVDKVNKWTEEAVQDKIDYYKIEAYTNVMYGVLHKIKWKIQHHFNNKLQALELKHNRNKATAARKKVKIIRSYKWQGRRDELPKLYQKLKGDLIAPENRLTDFTQVFSNKDIAIINPIKWHDNNASELLYFVMQLSEYGLIQGARLNYETLAGCFVTNDGKKFTASFKNLKQSIPVKLSGVKMAKIEALIKLFV